MPAEDLTGQRFNKLVAINIDRSGTRIKWVCQCDCGNIKAVDAAKLKNGHTKSCGCFRAHVCGLRNGTRLGTKSDYDSWRGAHRRCFDTNDPKYPHYGGRGITVCEEWKDNFPQFYEDMGPRPSGHTLDRIDNDGPYAPWNCKWSTPSEQVNNRRRIMRVNDLVDAGLVTWEQVNELRDRLVNEGR